MSNRNIENKDIDKIIGTRVKMLRTEKNLEQGELAQMLNISQSHLSRIESGSRGLSAQLFCAIAMVLEIDESRLNPYKNAPIWFPVTIPWSFQTKKT